MSSAMSCGMFLRSLQPEFLGALVVLEDRSAVQTRELYGARNDRLQHGLELERRAHRLPDFAQRLELATDRVSAADGPRAP
jgi:hypothetical protein